MHMSLFHSGQAVGPSFYLNIAHKYFLNGLHQHKNSIFKSEELAAINGGRDKASLCVLRVCNVS